MAYATFRRLTADEYHRMICIGVLDEDERVELLDGYLVERPPHGVAHDFGIMTLARRLILMAPDEWVVCPRSGIVFAESQPEPDFALVRGPQSPFRYPVAAEVALIIEVADASLLLDTRDKLRIYARDGVPEYWVVNIPARRIEVYTDPTGPDDAPTYRNRAEFPVGTTVPVVLDGTEVGRIAVADVIA